MKGDGDLLFALALQFALLSLMAVGGINVLIPEMHRQAVDVRSWMTDQQFIDLVALSQAAPGPNVMIVALIGQQAAGPLGAVVAMIAMCLPTAVLACVAARTLDRHREARWRRVIEAGLVPVTLGLVAAAALVIAREAGQSPGAVAVTAAVFAVAYWMRVTPLLPLAAAAMLGAAGWL